MQIIHSRVVAILLLALAPAAAHGAHFKTLHTFSGAADGGNPNAALTWHGGLLYGFTVSGGAHGMGTVFSVNATTGADKVVHDFDQMAFGEAPFPAMIFRQGLLYGTHPGGGAGGNGSVFAVSATTGVETDVYDFGGPPDGSFPQAGIIFVGGTMYGATQVGGSKPAAAGTVFRLDPATGVETVLHSFGFERHDGVAPNGLADDGHNLFGTTESGVSQGGVIFSIDPATGKERVLHQFSTADGTSPEAGLIYAGGLFFGTAPQGGASGYGTVFSFDPKTKKLTVLHDFLGGADGGVPDAGLAVHDGTLYGTTTQGGNFQGVCTAGGKDKGCGTVFQLDIATASYTVLHSFSGGADGAIPYAGVTYQAGSLYGVTYGGAGKAASGTVFAITP